MLMDVAIHAVWSLTALARFVNFLTESCGGVSFAARYPVSIHRNPAFS
jgi:hypothetical protein